MARNRFGGDAAAWFITEDSAGYWRKPGATITATFWSDTPDNPARVMYSDVRLASDPTTPINQITALASGSVPDFDGPDDSSITAVWASGDGGSTGVWIYSRDTVSPHRTVNGKALSADVSLTPADVGAQDATTLDADVTAKANDSASQLHQALSTAFAPRSRPPKSGAFTAFMGTLYDGSQSTALQIITDSTGYTAGKTRWPYLVAPWLGQQFPAYGVRTVTWNDTNQAFDAPVQVQAPPSGERYVQLGAGTTPLYHPGDGTALTGLEVEMAITPTDWASNAHDDALCSRWLQSGGTQKQFIFYALRSGKLALWWTADNVATLQATSSVAAALTNGQKAYVKVTLNPASPYAVNFYTSTDGTTWTQLGTTITGAAGTSLYDPGANMGYNLGGYNRGSGPFYGKVYYCAIRNGIGGLAVCPRVPDNWAADGSTTSAATFGGSPWLTIVNAARVGADIYYLSDSVRLPKMTPQDWGTSAVVMASSHNDTDKTGSVWLTALDNWLAGVRNRHPYAAVAITTQNPRTNPAGSQQPHMNRRRLTGMWAAKNNVSYIDVWRYFRESSAALTSLVDQTDGIHPTDGAATDLTKGSPLWAYAIEQAMLGRG